MNKSVIVYCAEDGGVWRRLPELMAALGLNHLVKGWCGDPKTFESSDHLYILHSTIRTIEWKRGDSGVRMIGFDEAKQIAVDYQKSVASGAPVAV